MDDLMNYYYQLLFNQSLGLFFSGYYSRLGQVTHRSWPPKKNL